MDATPLFRVTGRYVRQQGGADGYAAFIPTPLPPDPPLVFSPSLVRQLDRAALAVGRLDATGMDLPDARLFLYTYVRKEAVLSSQIEGTQSTLADLLLHENGATPGIPSDDVAEVSNYVAALEHGLKRIREGFPLSLRLLQEMHGILMHGGRGMHANAGEFRRSQNWIGGRKPSDARFVPPPAHEVLPTMGALEQFLHVHGEVPTLVKAGLVHVQFETIHPFLDGNGRLGRLLIALVLYADGILRYPLLYLSLYLKTYRVEYYAALERVRTAGDWEHWLEFYLRGVASVAEDATERAHQLRAIFTEDHDRIITMKGRSDSIVRVHEALKQRALLSIATACAVTGLTPPPVRKAIDALLSLGIVDEITGKQRDRVFRYRRYADVLQEEARV